MQRYIKSKVRAGRAAAPEPARKRWNMARKRYRAKNEFRYCKKTKHTAYVFEDDGKKYNAVGITHKEKTFGKKNMPLDNNPQRGKTEKAYIRNGIIRERHNSFGPKRNNFEFSETDFPKVKSKIRNYKKERKRNQARGTRAFVTITFVFIVALIVFAIARQF